MPKRPLVPSPTKASPRCLMSSSSSDEKDKVEVEYEGVTDPGVNDVISGRGDNINRHPGNVRFRKLVEEKRRVYLSSHFKREKRLIAQAIVTAIKEMEPPGRFLSKDSRSGLWHPIDEDRAREKASQALRENSKKIKAELQQSDDAIRKQKDVLSPGHTASSAGADGIHDKFPGYAKNGVPHDAHQRHYPYPPAAPGWGYPYYYGYQAPPPFPPPPFHTNPYPPPLPSAAGPPYFAYGPPRDPPGDITSGNESAHYSSSNEGDQEEEGARLPFKPMPDHGLRPRRPKSYQPPRDLPMGREPEEEEEEGHRVNLKHRKLLPFDESGGEEMPMKPPTAIKNESMTEALEPSSSPYPMSPARHASSPHPMSPYSVNRHSPFPMSPHSRYPRSPETHRSYAHLSGSPGYPSSRTNSRPATLSASLHVHHHYHHPGARTPAGPKTPVADLEKVVFEEFSSGPLGSAKISSSRGPSHLLPLPSTPAFLPPPSPEKDPRGLPFSPICHSSQQRHVEIMTVSALHSAKHSHHFGSGTPTTSLLHPHALKQPSVFF